MPGHGHLCDGPAADDAGAEVVVCHSRASLPLHAADAPLELAAE